MSGSPLPVDSLGMWEATARLPEQMAAAAAAAAAVPLGDLRTAEVANVVVVGTGTGGLAAQAVAALARPAAPVPVSVVEAGELPAYVGARSLVVAVSWAGDTRWTVAAADAARAAGARVVAVAGGGALARGAEEAGDPVVGVPAGIPQARAALGALAVPSLVLLDRLALFPGARSQVDEAVEVVARRRDDLVERGSLAQEVARRIGRTFPLVHGAHGLGAVAARRWKAQVNENAKSPAFWSVQPSLCHDEVVGWGQHGDVTRQLLTVVALRHGGEDADAAGCFDVVGELLDEVVAGVVEVRSAAEGDAAQLFDLVTVGDFVSLHLAAQEGTDPGPVPVRADMEARRSPSPSPSA